MDTFEFVLITVLESVINWQWEVFDSEIYGWVSDRIIVDRGLVGRKFENNLVIDAAECEALCFVLRCLAKMARLTAKSASLSPLPHVVVISRISFFLLWQSSYFLSSSSSLNS